MALNVVEIPWPQPYKGIQITLIRREKDGLAFDYGYKLPDGTWGIEQRTPKEALNCAKSYIDKKERPSS